MHEAIIAHQRIEIVSRLCARIENIMPQRRIDLLGSFHLTENGKPLEGFRSDKARALLAYLATTPDSAHRRDVLTTLLWPTFSNTAARANLRNVLSNLRRLLPDALTITRQTVQFNTAALSGSSARKWRN